MTDWTAVYQHSRPRLAVAGFLQLATAASFSLVGLIIAGVLYVVLDNGVPSLLFIAAGIAVGFIFGRKAWLDFKGDPVVIRGLLERKYTRAQSPSGGRSHFLVMTVAECFSIGSDGQQQLLPNPADSKKLRCQQALFEKLTAGATVSVVCTPSGQAFQQIAD
ncbi:MAG: hypothetical protein R3F53_30075 [Gammaproteobacteria bacterium]